jgi:hypothetical protein
MLPILVLLLPAAALAQTPPPAPERAQGERICRTTGELGSRLNRSRSCRTRAEWEESRRENRSTIDRAQRQFNPTVDEALAGN